MTSSQNRPRPSGVVEHLGNTKDSWQSLIDASGPFPPEDNRYHLYIGLFCPWAHRANLIRHLKGLTEVIPISIVKAYPKGDESGWPGWKFPTDENEYERATPDHLYGSEYLHDIYFKANPEYKGRYTVPVLWDKKNATIVNNESTVILRDLQTSFNSIIKDEYLRDLDIYPEALRATIDEIGEWTQRDLNIGVYRTGFAESQEVYEQHVFPVFAALNKLEKLIASNRGPFILGTALTELDVRLYPTIIRFDVAYVQHFKCNLGTIRSHYPQINNWMKGLYWGLATLPDGRRVWGFGPETTDFRHIKENYTKSHYTINPKAITPVGPWPDVEDGFEPDFSKLSTGRITMPEVIEAESRLQ